MKLYKKNILFFITLLSLSQNSSAASWSLPSEWWNTLHRYFSAFFTPKKKPEANASPAFKKLVANSKQFSRREPFPTTCNTIEKIAGTDSTKQDTIAHDAQNTMIIMHKDVDALLENFLTLKKELGTTREKAVYDSLSKTDFIKRLITQRPLMFMTAQDTYLLRNGKKGNGGFEYIGTSRENEPLTLKNYISYDEMELAALIGVSVPTYFINNGNRYNQGVKGNTGTFLDHGIYVGLVGARFEKPNVMEWRHMVITPEQNRVKNSNPLLSVWEEFYKTTFATYAQAKNDSSGRFVKIPGKNIYLDTHVYKKRLKMSIEPFILHANALGLKENKKVYCHAVGLGLGVWQLDQELQTTLMLEVYEQIFKENTLEAISDIDFSWFSKKFNSLGSIKNNQQFTDNGNTITIHFSERNPADPLTGKNAGKLLVAMYAWDGNSYPGNEYWDGALSASGDPAAACCSTIAELQNPEVNEYLLSNEPLRYGK